MLDLGLLRVSQTTPLLSVRRTTLPTVQCTGRPVRMVMLYNGGDLQTPFNVQGEQGLLSA
jgi:hypothetical protein